MERPFYFKKYLFSKPFFLEKCERRKPDMRLCFHNKPNAAATQLNKKIMSTDTMALALNLLSLFTSNVRITTDYHTNRMFFNLPVLIDQDSQWQTVQLKYLHLYTFIITTLCFWWGGGGGRGEGVGEREGEGEGNGKASTPQSPRKNSAQIIRSFR